MHWIWLVSPLFCHDMLVGCRYNQFFLSYIFFVLGSLFFVSRTCNSVIYNARGINKHIRTTQTATGWKSTSYQYFTKLHSACARNAWQILCLTNIRSSFFGWVRCFHVWSRPVLWLRFRVLVPFQFCVFFAMSYAPFLRLCRGFVGRQVLGPIFARNMSNGQKQKVLVTRNVPQAAIEIIKSSQR